MGWHGCWLRLSSEKVTKFAHRSKVSVRNVTDDHMCTNDHACTGDDEDSANRPKAGTQRYASVRIVDGYIRMKHWERTKIRLKPGPRAALPWERGVRYGD